MARRLRQALLGVTLFAVVATMSLVAAQAPPPAVTVTFAKDVAPIVYRSCANCHRPGAIAPMSLLTYEDARPWARAMRDYVASRQMPPWHADGKVGHFANDRSLSREEIATIVAWANTGARQGDPKDLPPMPTFTDGWTIGAPDAIFTMAEPFEVPAEGVVAYQYFQVPTNFAEDKWIQAIEVKPGDRSVVHHVIVFAFEPGAKRPRVLEFAPEQEPVKDESKPAEERPAGIASERPPKQMGGPLVGVAPGTEAVVLKPGMARQLKAGTLLTFQMHYTTNGKAARDRSSVGFVFAKEPPATEMRTAFFMNQRFVLPAGAKNERVDNWIGFTGDVRLHSLLPHTHLRGTRWEYTLVHADGRREPILSVPKYDFNWQTEYRFKEPLRIEKGSRIEASAWYDNSADNPSNPDPKADVRWGDQTWEEMMFTSMNYVVDPSATSSAAGGERPDRQR